MTTDSVRPVDELADVRAGDKGDTLILAVLARDPQAYDYLVDRLSLEAVAAHYQPLATGAGRRTCQENQLAIVFELPGVLGGGVTGAPVLDGHGKTMGYHLLGLAV